MIFRVFLSSLAALLICVNRSESDGDNTMDISIVNPLPPEVVANILASAGIAYNPDTKEYSTSVYAVSTLIPPASRKKFAAPVLKELKCVTHVRCWRTRKLKSLLPATKKVVLHNFVSNGPKVVRIFIPLKATLKGYINGVPSGSIEPLDPNGNPTNNADIFGDGSLVLETLHCPE